MSRSDRRSHIRQQVRRLQMQSQSFTFLYHKPISCYTIFRYVFCVPFVSIFLTGSSIGISCKQVKTRFASFPLLSRQSPRSRASADFGSLSAKKQQHFLTFSPENAAAFYFCKCSLSPIDPLNLNFFSTHRFKIGSISVIPLSPANFCLQISRRCS